MKGCCGKLVEDGGIGSVVVEGGVGVRLQDDVGTQDVRKELAEHDVGEFGGNYSFCMLNRVFYVLNDL